MRVRFNGDSALRNAPDNSLGTPRKYVLIYGAANQIGSAFARYFAMKGFNLVLIDESEEKLMIVESELNSILDARTYYQPNLGGNP